MYVELTHNGPVLLGSDMVQSVGRIAVYKIDKKTYAQLKDLLQTGELDNAKVKEVIKVK